MEKPQRLQPSWTRLDEPSRAPLSCATDLMPRPCMSGGAYCTVLPIADAGVSATRILHEFGLGRLRIDLISEFHGDVLACW